MEEAAGQFRGQIAGLAAIFAGLSCLWLAESLVAPPPTTNWRRGLSVIWPHPLLLILFLVSFLIEGVGIFPAGISQRSPDCVLD